MKPAHAPKFGALREIDVRNAKNLAAWTYFRSIGAVCPDTRNCDQVRRWLDLNWRMSQARAWLEVRERRLDQVSRRLCRVITFPGRGARR